jgi:hypothetical protein
MGFTGHYVFGRSDRPLREAPVFDQGSPASPDDTTSAGHAPEAGRHCS